MVYSILKIFLIGLCFFVSTQMKGLIQSEENRSSSTSQIIVPSLKTAKLVFLGNTLLAADLYWIKSNFYVLEALKHQTGYKELERLFSLIQGLNPRFCRLYKSAGLIFSRDPSGKSIEVSNRFFELGTQQCPGDWMLEAFWALNLYQYSKDYALAGQHFLNASKEPNAPAWVGHFGRKLMARDRIKSP